MHLFAMKASNSAEEGTSKRTTINDCSHGTDIRMCVYKARQ
jgi:hypothetical protein